MARNREVKNFKGYWKTLTVKAPVAKPSFVLPAYRNPRCLCNYDLRDTGMRFIWRKQPDGTTLVWRIS